MSNGLLTTYNKSLDDFERRGERLPQGPKRDIIFSLIDYLRLVIIRTDIELQNRMPIDPIIQNTLDRIEKCLDQIRHSLNF